MKESYYNFYIPQGNKVLLYNSLNNAYLVMRKDCFSNIIVKEKIDLVKLKEKYPSIFNSFINNGLVVDDDLNEKDICKNIYHQRKFSKKIYELTINPTLDCNLKCWYCYENHIKGSSMTDELVDKIIKHLEYKFKSEPYETLKLSFFGGEPILKPKLVKQILKKVSELSSQYNFKLLLHFTTNGTVLPQSLLSALSNHNVSFQITIDGYEINHNSIRILKKGNSKEGTYNLIIHNIKRICDTIEKSRVTVRINFSNDTFEKLESLVDDLNNCDRKKVFFSLHRVWQVDTNLISKDSLFKFIRYANSFGFLVYYMSLNNIGITSCYADHYNQAVINYDGKVFKCTARDFNEENSEGVLTKEGIINWKTDKLLDRMNIRIAENCKDCKLLPSCPGVCSQKRLENRNSENCVLDKKYSIEEYIIHNFNNRMLEAKIKAS